MRGFKKLFVVLLLVVSVFALFGCNKNKEETLKIGYFGNLPEAGDCLVQRNVIKLFVKKWNAEKTFGDVKVEYYEYDNTNNGAQDTEMSIKAAQKLINQDQVDIIVSAQLSNIIQATGQLINDAEVIDIGLGLSATWMQQGWKYVYRTALNNDYQVPGMTAKMKELGQNDVALLYQNTDNCLTFRDTFKSEATKAGLNLVADEMLPAEGGTGITGQVTKAINANPDCVFITAMGGSFGAVVKQLRQSGYKGMIYLGQPLTTTEVDSIGAEEVNGVAMFSPYIAYNRVEDCTNEFCKNVLQAYFDEYGNCPQTDMVYKIWDAMLLVENAVKKADSTDSKEIQAVISTLKFQGCAGTMDFTRGSNECYFGSQAWVYTGQGVAGGPTLLEDWLKTDLAKKIKMTK